MRGPIAFLIALAITATIVGGCGVQDQLLGTSGGLLLQGFDALTQPDRPVRVTAELRGGNYLSGMEGYLVGFYDRDIKLGQMRTDEQGRAWIEIVPRQTGQLVLLARLEDPDVRQYAVEAVEILIETREGDYPIAVMDLDYTLVNEDFEGVLTGQGDPMPHSLAVVERLARDHSIVYLTGRPTVFNELSKQWLRKNNYPLGPVLTHGQSPLGLEVESYKSGQLAALSRDFPNLRYGVGDLITDVRAYSSAGLHGILILHPDQMYEPGDVLRWLREVRRLPQEVDVVENWRQVEEVIFGGRRYPAERAATRLEQLFQERAEAILNEPADEQPEPPESPGAAGEGK